MDCLPAGLNRDIAICLYEQTRPSRKNIGKVSPLSFLGEPIQTTRLQLFPASIKSIAAVLYIILI